MAELKMLRFSRRDPRINKIKNDDTVLARMDDTLVFLLFLSDCSNTIYEIVFCRLWVTLMHTNFNIKQ